jgi:nucleotide-binding universal stress UspA family protein
MFTLKRILVPTDFGSPSAAALDYALGLASAVRASVSVFHAYEIPVVGTPDGTFVSTSDMVLRIESAAQQALEATVQAHVSDVHLGLLLRQGRPWEAIHDAAREIGADLIVMGTHGRRGLVRALLGSVTEKVMRTSLVPVVVVHLPSAPPGDDDARAPVPSAASLAGRSLG